MCQKSDRCRDIWEAIDFLNGSIEPDIVIFPTRAQVSTMTDLELVNVMSKMSRAQKVDMSAVPRCKRLLNSVRRLNRWITSENLEQLAQGHRAQHAADGDKRANGFQFVVEAGRHEHASRESRFG